jgi:hypothetical protein
MDEALYLPGLEPGHASDSAMVKAARQTLAALQAADKLRPEHALLTQLILSLAAAIDGGTRSGRASAVAMAAKELREALLQLDPPPEEGQTDAAKVLRDFMDDLERHANGGTPAP